jgi:hypothetical protein
MFIQTTSRYLPLRVTRIYNARCVELGGSHPGECADRPRRGRGLISHGHHLEASAIPYNRNVNRCCNKVRTVANRKSNQAICRRKWQPDARMADSKTSPSGDPGLMIGVTGTFAPPRWIGGLGRTLTARERAVLPCLKC